MGLLYLPDTCDEEWYSFCSKLTFLCYPFILSRQVSALVIWKMVMRPRAGALDAGFLSAWWGQAMCSCRFLAARVTPGWHKGQLWYYCPVASWFPYQMIQQDVGNYVELWEATAQLPSLGLGRKLGSCIHRPLHGKGWIQLWHSDLWIDISPCKCVLFCPVQANRNCMGP